MTIDRYTSQPIVGNIRVYEIFKGHRVLTERDRQMTDRLIDEIVDGVQLKLPDGMPGVKFHGGQWMYNIIDINDENDPDDDGGIAKYWKTVKSIIKDFKELCVNHEKNYPSDRIIHNMRRCDFVSRCVAFWDIAVRNLDNALPDAVDEYMAAVMQRDTWLSLLEGE